MRGRQGDELNFVSSSSWRDSERMSTSSNRPYTSVPFAIDLAGAQQRLRLAALRGVAAEGERLEEVLVAHAHRSPSTARRG